MISSNDIQIPQVTNNPVFETEWKEINQAIQNDKEIGLNWLEIEKDFEDIDYESSLKLDSNYKHAAHAFLWCRNDEKLWGYDLRASILMQMRFDGHIGFPGGFIDETDKSIEDGLNRELREELNLEESLYLSKENYLFSSIHKKRMNVLHFYVKEYNPEDYIKIELESMKSKDFGGEVMGIIRPPLLSTSRNRGLSVFVKNRFIGCSLLQLLKTIVLLKIIPFKSITDAFTKPIGW